MEGRGDERGHYARMEGKEGNRGKDEEWGKGGVGSRDEIE